MKTWQAIVKENDLQVSVVSLGDLNAETRLDSEYYRPEALLYLEFLENKKAIPISSIAKFVAGPFGSTVTIDKYVEEKSYSYIRNQDVNNFVINDLDAHISRDLFNKLPQFHIHENDLLATVVGTLGKVAIARKKDTNSIFSCKSTIIRCTSIDPYFLATFLNSKVGQTLLLRCKRGAIQEGLNLPDIKTLPIAIPTQLFQEQIRGKIREAIALTEKSESEYEEAEKLLLKEINLEGYVPSEENTSIRELADCLTDNRFDAEYWQLKFDGILERINAYTGGVSKIQDEFSQIKNNFKSDPETLYRYVEIGDVDVSTGEVSFSEMEGKELPANAKITLGEKQLVTSKVRPNRGATAILDNQKSYIASGAFVVLKEAGKVTLETLQVYLKTALIRDLLLRYNTGTAYPTIIDADILNLPLPLVNKNVQEAITEKVKQCSKERTEARELFEKAKRAVEIFIEKDEQEALKYLA